MRQVGSATPTINKGWPPNIEWIIPQIAVDANVSTVLKLPPVKAFRLTSNVFYDLTITIDWQCIRIKTITKIWTLKVLERFWWFTCISIELFSKSNDRKCRSKEYVESWGQYSNIVETIRKKKYKWYKKMDDDRFELPETRFDCTNPIMFVTFNSSFEILSYSTKCFHTWNKRLHISTHKISIYIYIKLISMFNFFLGFPSLMAGMSFLKGE